MEAQIAQLTEELAASKRAVEEKKQLNDKNVTKVIVTLCSSFIVFWIFSDI